MPLTIERFEKQISVTHYYQQNGDLVPDPDMEFYVLPNGEWLPVAIQQCFGTYDRACEFTEKGIQVRPKTLRDLINFSNTWARNLIEQGFHKATLERVD